MAERNVSAIVQELLSEFSYNDGRPALTDDKLDSWAQRFATETADRETVVAELIVFAADAGWTEPGTVSLAETIRGFREIVEGKHDDLPEQAFYMVGSIDEVIEKARKLAA